MTGSVSVSLSLEVPKKNAEFRRPSMPPSLPLYVHGDIIKGKFSIDLPTGTSVSHNSVTISLIGSYEGPNSPTTTPFLSKVLQVLPAAKLSQSVKSPFTFDRIPFPITSYYGTTLNLVYSVHCSLHGTPYAAKKSLCVLRSEEYVETPLCKQIGIVNVLHIQVRLKSTVIDPRGCFVGLVNLPLAKIRLVALCFQLMRKETGREVHEEVIAKFEVLDGATVKGVLIPVRFYVAGLGLWPAPKDQRGTVEYGMRVFGLDERDEQYQKDLPVSFAFVRTAATGGGAQKAA
jgi:vacuolar protein sorting-associated protein 26